MAARKSVSTTMKGIRKVLTRGFTDKSSREEFFDEVNGCLPTDGGDAFKERDFLGANLDAIAGLGAVAEAAVFHQRVEAIFLQRRAGGVIVEEADLADDCGADEMIDRGILRAGIEATSATDAARKGIAFFLKPPGDLRAFAQIVSSIDRDPGLDAFQIAEQT